MNTALILALALLIDAAFGEPRWIWSRIPHPAVLMGRLIGALDAMFNHGKSKRIKGMVMIAGLTLAALIIGYVLTDLPPLVQALLAAILLAQRSLSDHVRAVSQALRISLGDGRRMVARIVGRDTANMDDSAVARAAIESAAENLSDGIVAPAFWFLITGLPGLLAYKIVNTADSMIGYRTPRHRQFGWASAKLDDILNWVPARLTAALIALAHPGRRAWMVALRDARLHRSPNAGWPESAMAAALNIALAGPRSYHGKLKNDPYMHPEGRRWIGADEIDQAIIAIWRAWAVLLALTFCTALFL
jgi:adenosylcobinamide-phosphate synthase